MKDGLKKQLLARINSSPTPISGGELEMYAQELGFMGSNATRRCRELFNEGLINRIYVRGCVQYQRTEKTGTSETPTQRIYVPTVEKPTGQKNNTRTIQMDFGLVLQQPTH
jgi:hypothetical protein